jgi:hypothetical protein
MTRKTRSSFCELVFSRCLTRWFFAVAGLDAAVAIFEAYKAEEPFAALILDCALPRLDGFTLAKIVRIAEGGGPGAAGESRLLHRARKDGRSEHVAG